MSFVILGDTASVHTNRWADGLAGRGHAVTVIPSREPGPRGWRSLARWIRRRWQVRRLTARPGSVLVVHYVPAGIRALPLLGVHPRVGVAWGSDVFATTRDTPRQALAAAQQRLFLRGCDAVVAPSRHLLDAVVRAGGRADRAHCVPFGVDTARFAPGPDPVDLRRRLDLEGRRVVLSNRTIAPIYCQPTVVEAIASLPEDVVVVMTRHLARPSEIEAVQRRAAELNVGHRIRIIDLLPEADMPALYRMASVVVSIARSDGGPITVLEALATGRPVVGSDLPSLREWLADLEPDLLVPVGDAPATARAIRLALERSPEEAAAFAQQARAAIEARGSSDRALDAMESIHREVARGR